MAIARCVYRRFGRRPPANRGGMTAYPELIRYPYLNPIRISQDVASTLRRLIDHRVIVA
jgi:hypothetical protein